MEVIIAEKKDVANSIVDALFQGAEKSSSFFKSGSTYITWLSGHVLDMLQPEDENPDFKRWDLNHLPMRWNIKYRPKSQHENHVNTIIKLLKEATKIIHAGDPDPEGQRLVDEVIEYAHVSQKPCQRLLINDNNAPAIKKAYAAMKDNRDFKGLSQSALARAICDFYYGINLTRLYSLSAQKNGFQGVLSVGRVQTPILGLIVNRDRENSSHKSIPYYSVHASCDFEDNEVNGQYIPKKDDPVDEKNRLNNHGFASAKTESLKDQDVIIKSVETLEKQNPAPLPFNLLKLQGECSSLFGLKPDEVLEITQTLRDQFKAITYNRSDCQYLNDERFLDAPELLHALSSIYTNEIKKCDTTIKSKAFDSTKVSAHHAIIPTMSVPDLNKLAPKVRQVYEVIAKSYIALFMPPETYKTTKVIFNAGDNDFVVNGRVNLSEGWKSLYPKENKTKNDNDESEKSEDDCITLSNLEGLKEGMLSKVKQSRLQIGHTKPRPLFTTKSLLNALANFSQFVTDPHIKSLLLDKDKDKKGERGGLGTPATRSTIIKGLYTRGFIIDKGKNIVSTPLGQSFVDSLPKLATSPDLTALWHEQQAIIEEGGLSCEELVNEVFDSISKEVSRVKDEDQTKFSNLLQHKCPKCGKGLVRRKSKEGNGFWWSCSGYPDCNETFQDSNGEPLTDIPKCPDCKSDLIRRKNKDGKGFWWGCSGFSKGCKKTFEDKKGLPNFNKKEFTCPNCGNNLVQRTRKSDGGKFWSCSGYPNCSTAFNDLKGKPDFNK